jgi:hypothetical protein
MGYMVPPPPPSVVKDKQNEFEKARDQQQAEIFGNELLGSEPVLPPIRQGYDHNDNWTVAYLTVVLSCTIIIVTAFFIKLLILGH